MLNNFTHRVQALNPKKWLSHLARRVIAVDLGSSHIKVILAEESLGHVRALQHQIIDLHQEGLLSVEEINRHLRSVIVNMGSHPVALAIPQHLSFSHLIDLPRVSEREISALVGRETVNLSGLSDSAIIYDYQQLRAFGKHQNPFWVTISREQEIKKQIERVTSEDGEPCFCEVTTVANAMMSAYLSLAPDPGRVVLADLGATSTVIAIIDQGQAVYAASFPIGSESFTGMLASLQKCSFEEAEVIKRSRDLFAGPDRLDSFLAVVDIWRQDLAKLIREWEEDNPEFRLPNQAVRVLLCGGGAEQPGLLNYLQLEGHLEFQPWPDVMIEDLALPLKRFAAAYGLVRQTFYKALRSPSLLPMPLRAAKHRQQRLMMANWAGLGLVMVLSLLLFFGSIHKLLLSRQKSDLAGRTEEALRKAKTIETFIAQREMEFEKVKPLVERQRKTAEILRTLQVLQQVREKKDLWFLLLADRESYFAGTVVRPPENTPPNPTESGQTTNRASPAHGFVAELSIPDKSGDKLKTLRDLVDELKKDKLFRSVDSLPSSQRSTNFIDPKQLPLDRYFSLSLELMERETAPLLPAITKQTGPMITIPLKMH